MKHATLLEMTRQNRGLTLIETVMTVAILTIVMGTLFGIALGIGDTARIQEAKATTSDEARRALQQLVPELRQAAMTSVNWTELPGERITYKIAADLDGNGAAVNVEGALELSGVHTVQRDTEDVNGDGLTATQLVLIVGDNTRVLANELAPESESPNAEGVFGPEQDTNGNGRLDRGFWVEARDDGLDITVQAQGHSRKGNILSTSLTEFVAPRN